MRVGRLVAVLATVVSLTFATGMLLTAGGCSGSSGTTGPAGVDAEGQKVMQDRVKENQAKQGGLKGHKK